MAVCHDSSSGTTVRPFLAYDQFLVLDADVDAEIDRRGLNAKGCVVGLLGQQIGHAISLIFRAPRQGDKGVGLQNPLVSGGTGSLTQGHTGGCRFLELCRADAPPSKRTGLCWGISSGKMHTLHQDDFLTWDLWVRGFLGVH